MASTKSKTAQGLKPAEREITTECPKCHDLKSVRGLFWDDLAALGIDTKDEPRIERLCASCRYRQSYKNKPLTSEQKAKRKAYQKRRREQITHALTLAKAQEALQHTTPDGEVPYEPAE